MTSNIEAIGKVSIFSEGISAVELSYLMKGNNNIFANFEAKSEINQSCLINDLLCAQWVPRVFSMRDHRLFEERDV
jgi:hypothetical protein